MDVGASPAMPIAVQEAGDPARFAMLAPRDAARASSVPSPDRPPAVVPAIEQGVPEMDWRTLASMLGVAVSLACLLLLGVRRPGPRGAPDLGMRTEPRFAVEAEGSDSGLSAQLRTTAAVLLPAIRDNLDGLPIALPLRQTLARELATAAQRLETLAHDRHDTAAEQRRVRVRLQTVVRDLQRLQEITESAFSSLGTDIPQAHDIAEPRDKAEAYALLGVNADVNERVLKKLVDALRQSWHPDLARDDADRDRRERRIKQINVAWDVIQGKRVEA